MVPATTGTISFITQSHRKGDAFYCYYYYYCALSLRFIMLLSSHTHPMDTSGRRSRKMKGNYGSDNIYEQIRREKLQQQQQQISIIIAIHHHHPPDQRSSINNTMIIIHSDNMYRSITYITITTNYSRIDDRSSSSLEVNGMIYMVIIAVAVYIGHTYFGINPWQMILLLRMVQNGGGGGGGGFMWYKVVVMDVVQTSISSTWLLVNAVTIYCSVY